MMLNYLYTVNFTSVLSLKLIRNAVAEVMHLIS